jgi:hypothetical protein
MLKPSSESYNDFAGCQPGRMPPIRGGLNRQTGPSGFTSKPMTPEDIFERSEHKDRLQLGAEALEAIVKLNYWNAARATLTQLDFHLSEIVRTHIKLTDLKKATP